MSNKIHPYLKRSFWIKKQEEYKPNINFTDKGNKLFKNLIDKFVDESFAK